MKLELKAYDLTRYEISDEGPVTNSEVLFVLAHRICKLAIEEEINIESVKIDHAKDPDWQRLAQPGFD